jgi:hypothetical protein
MGVPASLGPITEAEKGRRPHYRQLDSLTYTLNDLGRHQEALLMRQWAPEIAETALGPNHSDSGPRLNNLT